MNYRYKVRDENIIVSSDEHKWIQEQTKDDTNANQTLRLRNGELVINTAIIGLIVPTDQPTTVQEDARLKTLKLPEMSGRTEAEKRKRIAQFLKVDHDKFYAKMHWSHGPNCTCKKPKK